MRELLVIRFDSHHPLELAETAFGLFLDSRSSSEQTTFLLFFLARLFVQRHT